MPVSSRVAAKTVANLCDFELSNLKLQKLLYLSHMIHLGRHSESLIDGHFEAWDFGPVEPDIYHLLKAYGNNNIRDVFGCDVLSKDTDEYKSIEFVVNQLKNLDAYKLVEYTHEPIGAWIKNYDAKLLGIKIPEKDIIREYQDRLSRSKKQ